MIAGRRVMVVEDENIVAMDLKASLERLGYEVSATAGSGAEALLAAERQRPDLVLMDIQIRGDKDGIETAELLRRRYDVPVVYLTAYADEATLARARVTEPYGYMLKPFDERELHIVTEMALFRWQAQKEHARLLQEEAARAAIEKQADWAEFLVQAGARLSSSLDLSVTTSSVTALAVPRLGDWAMLHLTEGDHCRVVSVKHAGGREAEAWELLRRAEAGGGAQAHQRVMNSRRPELINSPDEMSGAADLEVLRRLGARSVLMVPLVVRDQLLGVLTAATTEQGRDYGFEDVGRAVELAQHSAHALDNARLYQLAQEALAVRDDFVTIATHELRTPVASLLLRMRGLQRAAKPLGDEALLGRIQDLQLQSEGLAELVERLLDVSRMPAAGIELSPGEMDLAALVREVTSRLGPAAVASGCDLEVRAPETLPGRWDRVRLGQVLTNLLDNAFKFASGQKVEVTLEADERQATLVVRDEGTGIDPDRLPEIFERFARGVSSRNYGGLGLGLYVAREIVQAHGGTISARSQPGAGATFTVTLPRTSGAAT